MSRKIGIIGFGNMGEAIAAGLLKAGSVSGDVTELGIIEQYDEKAERAEREYSAKRFHSYGDLFAFADITVLAVKPQDMRALFDRIGIAAAGKRIISIAAGIRISTIQAGLQTAEVVRFMPNLAAKTGTAAVGISYAENCTEQLKTQARSVAEAVGYPVEIPERLQPAFTGMSGSGIAYVFAFLHGLALGGTSAGFSYPAALEIALRTAEGAVKTLSASGDNPAEMITRVCSPGGTTIQGIKTLEEEGFTAALIHAVERTAERAAELEG